MFNEQLKFNIGENEMKDREHNYYIYNGSNIPNDFELTEEIIEQMQRERIAAIIENESMKEKYKQQQENLIYIEQLDYNNPVIDEPIENPMLYSFGQQNIQKKQKPPVKNKNNGKKPKINVKKNIKTILTTKKKQTQKKKPLTVGGDFNLSTGLNNKGLFDPNLKVNELDRQSYLEKQRQERMEKIKGYELKYGRRVKNLEMYNNFSEAYYDLENKKNEYEYIQYLKHPYKYKDKNDKGKDELIEKLKNLKKPKLKFDKSNLDFNFDKYETMVKALEEQIINERIQREKENKDYMQKLKEYNILMEANENPQLQKQAKRSKSAYRNVRSSRYGRPQQYKIGSRFKRQLSQAATKVKRVINKAQPKKSNDEMIKEKAKLISKSLEKIIDQSTSKYFDRINQNTQPKLTLPSQEHEIIPSNINKIELQKFEDNNIQQANNKDNIIKDTFSCNNFVVVPNTGIDLETANKLINEELINQKLSTKNKVEMISTMNNTVQNQTLPRLERTIQNLISKISKNNIISMPKNPKLSNAIKASGKTIHLHINEIISAIIEDLLFEQVYELQFIEDITSKREVKENFFQYINDFFKTYKEMEKYEKGIVSQLSSNNKLAPYESCTPQIKEIPLDTKYLSQITSNNASTNNETVILKRIPPYRGVYNELLYRKCEIYRNDYLEYMKEKGSFYFDNIFGIYDEVVNETCNTLLTEQLEFCMKQVNDFVSNLAQEEVQK